MNIINVMLMLLGNLPGMTNHIKKCIFISSEFPIMPFKKVFYFYFLIGTFIQQISI